MPAGIGDRVLPFSKGIRGGLAGDVPAGRDRPGVVRVDVGDRTRTGLPRDTPLWPVSTAPMPTRSWTRWLRLAKNAHTAEPKEGIFASPIYTTPKGACL